MKIMDELRLFVEKNEKAFEGLTQEIEKDDDVTLLPTLHAFQPIWTRLFFFKDTPFHRR